MKSEWNIDMTIHVLAYLNFDVSYYSLNICLIFYNLGDCLQCS